MISNYNQRTCTPAILCVNPDNRVTWVIIKNIFFIVHSPVFLQPEEHLDFCYSLHHMFTAVGKQQELSSVSPPSSWVCRGEQQLQASLFLHLPASASASMKCLYLGISQWKLALRFIPFPFLITGCRPAFCLSAVAAPLTNSTDLRWRKELKCWD